MNASKFHGPIDDAFRASSSTDNRVQWEKLCNISSIRNAFEQ